VWQRFRLASENENAEQSIGTGDITWLFLQGMTWLFLSETMDAHSDPLSSRTWVYVLAYSWLVVSFWAQCLWM
jgi:hypothetical protein